MLVLFIVYRIPVTARIVLIVNYGSPVIKLLQVSNDTRVFLIGLN